MPILPIIAAAAGGAAIKSLPALLPDAAERENKKRLEELQKMEELGTLGLTEEEKQSIFGSQQAQIQGQIQAAQAQSRAAGAAGMAGAGAAQLQAAKAAETQAGLVAKAQRDLEAQNIQRKRELEQEIQARIAAKTARGKERGKALAGIASAGFTAGMEELGLKTLTGGEGLAGSEISNAAKELGLTEDQATQLIQKILQSGDFASYTDLIGE